MNEVVLTTLLFFNEFLRFESGIQFAHCIFLHAGKQMRIDIHRHANLRMTQQFLYNLGCKSQN